MLTRAAARRLADATLLVAREVGRSVEDADAAAAQNAEVDSSQASKTTDNAETVSASSVVARSAKRKRASKRQAQPLKGGWVLPHGMGAGVAESNSSNAQGTELLPPTTLVTTDLPADAVVLAQKSSATSQASTEQAAPKQIRQTRLTFRVTKTRSKNRESTKEQMPVLKLEETDDLSIKEENDDEGNPRKRLRTVTVAQKTTSVATASEETIAKLSKVKSEERTTLGPKVLIIKGIKIIDNIVTKASSRIVVDASQLLDPNFRIMVKRGKDNPYGLTPGYSPYPYRRVPTPEACEEVHRILTELHGEVKQPEKIPVASLEVAGCGEVPCVLDALLRTLISGNTLMALADLAIKNLSKHYGLRKEGTGAGSIDWDKVRLSSHEELAEVIKVAGNGPKRSVHIKQILDMVYEENIELAKARSSVAVTAAAAAADSSQTTNEPAKAATPDYLSLDHMHGMTKDEAMAKFVSYPGIGIKTAACVALFCLRMPCFAVDTHVHKFCRWLGWVPEKADPDNCFRHGEATVPDHLKYGLHQLFIRHGQLCFKCRKQTKPGTKDWNEAPICPLEHLLDRSKDEAGSKPKKVGEVKEVKEVKGVKGVKAVQKVQKMKKTKKAKKVKEESDSEMDVEENEDEGKEQKEKEGQDEDNEVDEEEGEEDEGGEEDEEEDEDEQ